MGGRRITVLTKTDIDNKGLPTEPLLNQLAAKSVDVVVNLSFSDALILHYIARLVNAGMKIALAHHQKLWYNFTFQITPNEGLDYFTEQIKSYLRTIKSKKF